MVTGCILEKDKGVETQVCKTTFAYVLVLLGSILDDNKIRCHE